MTQSAARPPPAKVVLIPWDTKSAEHSQRMFDQRWECGWNSHFVNNKWKKEVDEGTKCMYWIVLDDAHPRRDELLEKHMSQFPKESTPLIDSATAIRCSPRSPSNKTFVPVGHVAIATGPIFEKMPDVGVPSGDMWWIKSLYISWSLQNGGLGRAAMQAIEKTMTQEPINATVCGVDTVPTSFQMNEQYQEYFYRQRKLDPPKVSNEEWYGRQGYENFFTDLEGVLEFDQFSGGMRAIPRVFFRKKLI